MPARTLALRKNHAQADLVDSEMRGTPQACGEPSFDRMWERGG